MVKPSPRWCLGIKKTSVSSGLLQYVHLCLSSADHEFHVLPKQLETIQEGFLRQAEFLSFLAANLPPYLPGQPPQSTAAQEQRGAPPAASEGKQGDTTHEAAFGNENAPDNAAASLPTTAEGGGAKKKRPPAPRRCASGVPCLSVISLEPGIPASYAARPLTCPGHQLVVLCVTSTHFTKNPPLTLPAMCVGMSRGTRW